MNIDLTQEILSKASIYVKELSGTNVKVVDIIKPPDSEYAVHLSKVVSKLSPLIGNMIEYNVVSTLNSKDNWSGHGKWKRRDPGFPDTIFVSSIKPEPGIEIKTWFPLATEITARFKDSISHFTENQTNVAMLAWIPEHVIYGIPKIIDVWIDSAKSVAQARDDHYHNPPDYIVIEPEDTTDRTKNLQQTNTNGYKFQGDKEQFVEAEKIVKSWGVNCKKYSPSKNYQQKIRSLISKYPYRLDTNFAKMDRIKHPSLEEFKGRVLDTLYHSYKIEQWVKIVNDSENEVNKEKIAHLIK